MTSTTTDGSSTSAIPCRANLSPDLDDLIWRMCTFYAKNRCQSMKELLEDLAILR